MGAAGTPLAVIRATSAAEVQEIVRACHRHRVPVVARGAGTGLCGGANAIDGRIVITLDRMNQILEIDPLERLAVVQPGVVNDELRAAVAAHGLWYPPDPASSPWSTIGGNVATNAGGLCCVKYGVTWDHVLALEVVTGTGEWVRLGRRTAKGVAGYDLAEAVCIPKARVPDMLERIERIADRHRITIANIAHAGDGNLHPLLLTEPDDEAARVRAGGVGGHRRRRPRARRDRHR